jgi:hypothetical protein
MKKLRTDVTSIQQTLADQTSVLGAMMKQLQGITNKLLARDPNGH